MKVAGAAGRFSLPEERLPTPSGGQRLRTPSSPSSNTRPATGKFNRLSLGLRGSTPATDGRPSSQAAGSPSNGGRLVRSRTRPCLDAPQPGPARVALRAAGSASLAEQPTSQAREPLGQLLLSDKLFACTLPSGQFAESAQSSFSRPATSDGHAPKVVVRSKSEANLGQRLFKLADGDSSGKVKFQDFAWLHWKLANGSQEYSSGTVDQSDMQFPHHAFRKVDTNQDQSLEHEEWDAYQDTLASVMGKHTLSSVAKGVLRENEEVPVRSRYDAGASRQLLDRVTCATYLSTQHMEMVESLLDQQADPNQADFEENTVLMHAAAKSDPAFLEKLLMRGGNASINNKNYESAVFAAAHARQPELFRLLLLGKHSSYQEVAVESKWSSALVNKMTDLSPKEVRDLVLRGADPNCRSSQGWTPLIAAVFWGRQELVECLLRLPSGPSTKSRVRVNARDARGRTALHVAARKGKIASLNLLTGVRADVNMQDIDGWTPLHHAVMNKESESVVALIRAGADLNVKDENGFTPYMMIGGADRTDSGLPREATEMLAPPEAVNFARKILPILKDSSLTPYEKVDQLLSLPGVQGQFSRLRLYDQMFSRTRGPNKIGLGKLWDLLCDEMVQRLLSNQTDLQYGELDFEEQQRQRLSTQRHFTRAWMEMSRGPPLSDEWSWDCREGYREALMERVQEQVEAFQKRSPLADEALQAQPGYEELVALPADEIVMPQYLDQRKVHGMTEWLTTADPVSAFEALRDVQALGEQEDRQNRDREALNRFMDLLSSDPDFNTGPAFWQNIYKLWLDRYARLVNTDFQAKIRRLLNSFSEETGFECQLYSPPPKGYVRMKTSELRFGSPDHEDVDGRALACRMLDIVRCSITVDTPKAVLGLVQAFRDAGNSGSKWGKLELVRLRSGFHPERELASEGRVPSVTLSVIYHGGARHVPRTGGQMEVAIVGEVQIFLPEFLAIHKSMDPLKRFLQEEEEDTLMCPGRFRQRTRSFVRMLAEDV